MDIDNFETHVGEYVHATFPVPVYKNPGEKEYRTVKPDRFIGMVKGYNSKGNFIQIEDGMFSPWIYNDSKYTYVKPGTLTNEQKADVIKIIIDNIPAGQVGGSNKALNTAIDVGTGVVNTGDTILDTVGFLGKNLRGILITLLVIIIIVLILYATNTIKSLKP